MIWPYLATSWTSPTSRAPTADRRHVPVRGARQRVRSARLVQSRRRSAGEPPASCRFRPRRGQPEDRASRAPPRPERAIGEGFAPSSSIRPRPPRSGRRASASSEGRHAGNRRKVRANVVNGLGLRSSDRDRDQEVALEDRRRWRTTTRPTVRLMHARFRARRARQRGYFLSYPRPRTTKRRLRRWMAATSRGRGRALGGEGGGGGGEGAD